MSPQQSRAARACLGWSQVELAKRAGVSLSTVQDFERGQRTPIANNIAAMRRVIEAAGIRLVLRRVYYGRMQTWISLAVPSDEGGWAADS
jgi:transcriptional regulator with XRE-family HTH domain